MKYKS